MNPRTVLVTLGLSLLLAFLTIHPALAASNAVQPAATLNVTLNFSPNPVSQGSQTQIQISISGGTGPYWLWFNGTVPGCAPPSNPFQEPNATASYGCNPSSTGTFSTHLDVADSAGNHGSATATLSVQSGGNNTGGTGGNNTGGFNLGGLQDLLGVLMIVGIVFLACVVAIAASSVAMAVLIPRRLKQIRKAIQGEPMKKAKAVPEPQPEPVKPEGAKADPPQDEL